MKKGLRITYALALTLLWSCSDQDEMSPSVIQVEDYQQVSVAGNMIVRFKQDESTADNQDEVHIISSAYQDQINVSSQDGELRIVGENINLDQQVVIEIYPGPLNSIRLESGQKAIFEGVITQTDLDIVTEGNSELALYGLQVDEVRAKLEGESKLVLSTWLETATDSIDFPKAEAFLLGENTLQLDAELVKGDSVKAIMIEGQEVWRVYGQEINFYYYPKTFNFKTEGKVTLDAIESPVEVVNINLQGTSEATVWATDRISGKGEGESALTYKGQPVVSEFILQGSAQLLEY